MATANLHQVATLAEVRRSTRATGQKTKCKVMAVTNLLLELFILVSGKKVKCMVKVKWSTLMELHMTVNGQKT